MPRQGDTYTAAQAAQVLGVSERRVRQLVNEGKLEGARSEDGTVRLSQQAVNDERKRRRSTTASKTAPAKSAKAGTSGRRAAAATTPEVDVDALATAVASAVGQRLEGQLEITRQAESSLRDELSEERAKRTAAEAQLADAQRRIAELEAAIEASKSRGLFRRRS